MRKLLLLLLMMLMTVGSSYANYFYIDESDIPTVRIGETVEIPISAHFDTEVSAWDLVLTCPDGLVPKGVRIGNGMTITYVYNGKTRKEYGSITTNEDFTHLVSVSMTAGYDDEGNEYGALRWEPGDYEDFFFLTFKVTEFFQEGEITFTSKTTNSWDARNNDFIQENSIWDDYPRGDADGNGMVGISDVTSVISYAVYGNSINVLNADVNYDGEVDFADAMALFDALLSGYWQMGYIVNIGQSMTYIPREPDPKFTPIPEIIVEEGDAYWTITAYGEGVVHLFANGAEVENPCIIHVAHEDQEIIFEAYAESEGMLPSEMVSTVVYIPGQYNPHYYGCWIVLINKYGDEIWKELTANWFDEVFYELPDGLQLDLTTYSVIDYYTETLPYKPVQCYVMIDGVRYGPETPDLNPVSGNSANDDLTGGYAYYQPLTPQNENYFAFPAGYQSDYLRVMDDQLVIGNYLATGLPIYDSWTSVIAIDKNGNEVELRVGVDDIDFSSDLFGSTEYNGLVPFYLKHYTIHEPYGSTPYDVIYSIGAEVDGTEAIFGVPYAQKVKKGTNKFLAPAGFTYQLGTFENYLYALQVGRLANCTDENTSFTVNKLSVPIGDYLTFRTRIGLKAEYVDRVSDIKLIVQMPPSCPLYENSVMVGDEICSNYTVNSNIITIPLSDYSEIVRFCAIPSATGDCVANAYLLCNIDGETVREPIGLASFNAFNFSIMVPHETTTPDFMVRGTAANGSTVKVYLDDVQVAQTTCLANGSWHVSCSLNDPVNSSTHWVYAIAETKNGEVFWTDSKEILYIPEAPQPETITMYYKGQTIVFDFVNGTTTPIYYNYVPGYSQFTFTAKLKGTTVAVQNLKIKVLDTSGEVKVYDAVYNVAQGIWVCTASYPYTDRLPTSVGVAYDYIYGGVSCHYETVFVNHTNGVTPNAIPCIDPSGYVYEAVPSNRLEGVTTTAYYKDSESSDPVLWDAAQYEQENPLLTDKNGFYRWDVPIGIWQVKYEKEGYQTVYSEWLPVPPPQLDVNIGMTEMRQPEVIKAHAYPNAVELEFSKYMKPETLTTGNITVSVNGTPVSGTIQLLNEEAVSADGPSYASRVRFNAAKPFNADKVTLRVKKEVENYAGLKMAADYEAVLTVVGEMLEIVADDAITVPYQGAKQLVIAVLPASASADKVITVSSTAPMIASVANQQYTLDSNGTTIITVRGELPGQASLLVSVDGYDLKTDVIVNVELSNARRGDVNGDGEVNIADVNALISIILGGQADSETRARADVNNDSEINIADINAVIDIILNPSASLMPEVNCSDQLHINDLTLKPGETGTLSVTVDNAERYSALQCDIVLPDGLTLVNAATASGEVKTSEVSANTSRAVTYSMDLLPFNSDSKPVLTLTVRADAALTDMSQVTLTDVVLSDIEGTAWYADGCTAMVNNASGVKDLSASADRLWTEGRTLCVSSQQGGTAHIATVGGIVYDLPLGDGVTRRNLEPGIYVVVINGTSHKIAIR